MKGTNWDDDNTVLEVRNDVVDLGDQEERLVDYDAAQTNVVTSAILDERTDRTPLPTMRPAAHQALFPEQHPSAQPPPAQHRAPPRELFPQQHAQHQHTQQHYAPAPQQEPFADQRPQRPSAPRPAVKQLFPDSPPLRPSGPMELPRPPRQSVPMMARTASPTPSAPMIDADLQSRVASLSLDKGPVVGAGGAPRAASKLPWILLVVVAAGGGIYHYTTIRDLEQPAAPAANAATGSGQKGAAATAPSGSLLASGYIAAKAPIVISATTTGRLQEVRVDNGDMIQKGQVLAVMNDSSIRAELGLAGAHIRDAQRAYKRVRMLASAQAATPADVERAMGAVEVAQAEYRVTQQKLEDMRIKSPINGTVLEVIAHPGETLSAGPTQSASILKIADLSALVAEVDVTEAELKNVRLGQPAEVSSEAQRGKRYRGVVREIAEQADRARGTVLVKVDIGALIDDEFPPPAKPAGGSAAGSGGSAAPAGSANAAAAPPAGSASKAPPLAPAAGSAQGSAAPAAGSAAPGGAATDATLKPGMAIQVRFLTGAAALEPPPPPPAPAAAPAPAATPPPAAEPAPAATPPAKTPPPPAKKKRR